MKKTENFFWVSNTRFFYHFEPPTPNSREERSRFTKKTEKFFCISELYFSNVPIFLVFTPKQNFFA